MLMTALAGSLAALASAPAGAAGHAPKTAPSSSSSSDEGSTLPTGRGALRQIVQNQCVLNWRQHNNPAPCESVSLTDPNSSDSGYALLADPDGGAHYLLVPTQTMAGIDSSELLDPDAPNYFAEAWHARGLLAKSIGHAVPRTATGLVVNTAQTRRYDQFHVNIECVRQDVSDALRQASDRITGTWSPLTIAGATFQAMQIAGDGLDGANLFESLAALKGDTVHHMGDYTLVAVGAQFASGPGFILLTGTGPSGDFLLDPRCAVAGGGG
jgi:CDP-diacylglycerol pyrophosphatase